MAMAAEARLGLDGAMSRRSALGEADLAYGLLARGEITGRAIVETATCSTIAVRRP